MSGDESDERALERALRAPGAPAELAGEEGYREMFRASRAATPPAATAAGGHAAVRRIGAGTSLAVIVAVATGGVAAAYSSNLPDPVQRAVHSVLAPLGVPKGEPRDPVANAPTAPETPAASPPTAAPHPSEVRSARPAPGGDPTAPQPSTSPTATTPPPSPAETPSSTRTTLPPESASEPAAPSATPTPTPTDPPPPIVPPAPVAVAVAITSAGAGHKVAPGGTAVVTGQVSASDGSPVADVRVRLQLRTPGTGWQRLATTRTAGDGSVAVSTGSVERTLRVRLKIHRAHSRPWRLAVRPTLIATSSTVDQTSTLTVGVNGGQPGDSVVLMTRREGALVGAGSAVLDGSGSAHFDVPAPKRERWYAVRLPATRDHAGARTRVRVAAAPMSPSADSGLHDHDRNEPR